MDKSIIWPKDVKRNNVNADWNKVRSKFVKAAIELIGKVRPQSRKEWIMKEITDLINQRRNFKTLQ